MDSASRGARSWLHAVVILAAFFFPLSLIYPFVGPQSWTRGELIGLYQTILLFWTLVGAAFAAYFAGKSWKTQIDALQVSNYQVLSSHWNETYDKLREDPEAVELLNRHISELRPGEERKVAALAQEIFTTFDSWLVQSRLNAYPKVHNVDTWQWWHNTIVDFFMIYPYLVEADEQAEILEAKRERLPYWSPWLRQTRKDAQAKLKEKAK